MHSVDPNQPFIVTVPDLLSATECEELVERVEELGLEIAPINTWSGTVVSPSIRNNERVMFDDQELADTIFSRLEGCAPPTFCDMKLVGANERFRCLSVPAGNAIRSSRRWRLLSEQP